MTWKIWCPEVFFFFFQNFGCSWALFAQMPFIDSVCETYRGRRSVRSALQERNPLIYRPLIRLALWRFYQANDEEVSPSFCVSPLSACSLPSPGNPVSVLYPSLAPSITTPYTEVMMQFMGSTRLPYIATGAPPQTLFVPRAHCGLNSSWTVSFLFLHKVFLKKQRHYYTISACFILCKYATFPVVRCVYLCLKGGKWLRLLKCLILKCMCSVLSFSLSLAQELLNRSQLFWQKWLRNRELEQAALCYCASQCCWNCFPVIVEIINESVKLIVVIRAHICILTSGEHV